MREEEEEEVRSLPWEPEVAGPPDRRPSAAADELTVPRYRTEKPSKSPPPPPPRRSFPSSHGLTTTRTGEVVVTSKKDSTFIKVPPLGRGCGAELGRAGGGGA